MLEIGKVNSLRIVKEVDFGCYLDGGAYGEILLPKRYMPAEVIVDEDIEVFIYFDSEDRIIATTLEAKAQIGEFAYLKVVQVSEYGAFMDWGIPTKHLFVPFKEQAYRMEEGRSYVVFLYFDEKSERIAASSRLNRFLSDEASDYKEGQTVKILVAQRTDLGYKAVIEGKHWGVIYNNEVFRKIKVGDKIEAYIKKIRGDRKIDLALQQQGYRAAIDPANESILDMLKEKGGYLPVNDKSQPELIYTMFQMSKKMFKKSIGNLYKQKKIKIEEDGIYLIQ